MTLIKGITVAITHFKIGTRLIGGFSLLIILMLVMAAIGIYNLASVQARLSQIATTNNAEVKLITTMHSAAYHKALAVRNIERLKSPADKQGEQERLLAQEKRYVEAEQKLETMLSETGADPEQKVNFAKIREAKVKTFDLINAVVELGLAGKSDEAATMLIKEVRPVQREWFDQMNHFATTENELSERAAIDARAAYVFSRNMIIGIALLAMVLGSALALLITRSVTRPINEAVTTAVRVAKGDLTARIDVMSSDETGQLMQALKDMNESLKTLIKQTHGHAENVASAAAELATASGQVASGSHLQSEAASSMAASVEEMTVSVNQIADHANEAYAISADSSNLATEGGEIINATIGEMTKIAASVNECSDIVRTLATQSEQISGIVGVIKDVAEQTNLLALNAAIEAARAGEQGRGFAVVADEVRKLAERTSLSTVEISSVIGKIQLGIISASESMRSGVERVNQGMAQAERAGESVKRINAGAQRVVSAVNDISAALKEQGIATEDIANSVERVAQMAEENSAAVSETASTAQHLERLATELHETVYRFKT